MGFPPGFQLTVEPAEGASVRVRVRDAAGNALEGARVGLVLRDGELVRGPRGRFPDAVTTLRPTDALGEATLEPRWGPWRVWAGMPGWQHVPSALLDGTHAPASLELVLEPLPPEQRIAGRVVTQDGRPAAALVRFVTSDPEREPAFTSADHATGRFELFLDAPFEAGGLHASVYADREGSVFRAPVRGGEHDLEIVLGAPRPLTIEIEDPAGRPEPNVGLRLERWLLGHWVADFPGPLQEDSAFLAGLPDVPFRITVSGHGYETLVREVAPGEAGPRLVLSLARQAALSGVVRREGRPVEGADVRLLDGQRPRTDVEAGLEDSQRPRGVHGRARTDARGAFALPFSHDGTFWIEVSDKADGHAELGPLALRAGTPCEVAVDLERRLQGSISGRVRVPEGHALPTLLLEGPDSALLAPARDGSFRAAGLAPGRWCVWALESRVEPADEPSGDLGFPSPGFPSHQVAMPHPDAAFTAWEVVLEPGDAARLDPDLTRPPACRLIGTLAVDGEPVALRKWGAGLYGLEASANTVTLERLDRGHWEPAVARFRHDGTNRFTLAAHEPGDYRLRLEFGHAGQSWKILDRVTLSPGDSRLDLDLETGEIVFESVEPGITGTIPGQYHWRGQGERRVFAWSPHLDSATGARVLRVPAGEGEWSGPDGAGGGEPRRVRVSAGGRTPL